MLIYASVTMVVEFVCAYFKYLLWQGIVFSNYCLVFFFFVCNIFLKYGLNLIFYVLIIDELCLKDYHFTYD